MKVSGGNTSTIAADDADRSDVESAPMSPVWTGESVRWVPEAEVRQVRRRLAHWQRGTVTSPDDGGHIARAGFSGADVDLDLGLAESAANGPARSRPDRTSPARINGEAHGRAHRVDDADLPSRRQGCPAAS
jgi:hypothetical protein